MAHTKLDFARLSFFFLIINISLILLGALFFPILFSDYAEIYEWGDYLKLYMIFSGICGLIITSLIPQNHRSPKTRRLVEVYVVLIIIGLLSYFLLPACVW